MEWGPLDVRGLEVIVSAAGGQPLESLRGEVICFKPRISISALSHPPHPFASETPVSGQRPECRFVLG